MNNTGIQQNNLDRPGLEKIGETLKPCLHPEHNPPTHLYLEPGIYKYTCPGCGSSITFTVPAAIM